MKLPENLEVRQIHGTMKTLFCKNCQKNVEVVTHLKEEADIYITDDGKLQQGKPGCDLVKGILTCECREYPKLKFRDYQKT